jgi:ribosomal protein L29
VLTRGHRLTGGLTTWRRARTADLRGKTRRGALYITATQKALLDTRFKNYTNQLDDTSQDGKLRREIARAADQVQRALGSRVAKKAKG